MNNPILVVSVGEIIGFILAAILLIGVGLLWLLEKLFGEKDNE